MPGPGFKTLGALAVGAAVAFVGCTGGDSSSNTPRRAELTTAELRAMMPAKNTFPRPGLSKGTLWNEDFEPLSNRRAPTFSVLFDVTRAELVEAGRISGYLGGYWNGCGGLCFPGLTSVYTEVDVFGTAEQASRLLADQVATYRHLAGKKLSRFVRLDAVESFDPGDIGREAVEIRSKSTLLREEGWFSDTVVMFRVGRIIGLSRTGRYLQQDTSDRALALARALESRIVAVSAERD
jgi:hypothetical protein